jgi:purine-binding chemotaxis protein CheW
VSEELYGVFSLGPAEVALPLSELREVIPRPLAFETLPVTAPGLVGAVNLRHLVIPVLDLRRLVTTGATGSPADVIVIVAHDGHVFGLLADDIRGVVTLPDDALFETTVNEGVPLFSHSFERPDNGTVVCVLDCNAIAALPGAPRVRDVPPPKTFTDNAIDDVVRDGISGSHRMMMLLRSGTIGLCIDVNHVHSVVPQLVIKESTLAQGPCRGIVHLDGYEVPAVDPLALIGLGSLPAESLHRGVAIRLPRGLIVLTVSEVASIEAVPGAAIVPLPRFGMPRPDLLLGILKLPNETQHLILDGETLRAQPELDTLAGLGMPLGGTQVKKATPEEPESNERRELEGREIFDSVRPFLTYNVGLDVATPLMQISEIMPYPADLIPLHDGAVRGLFVHRTTSVPLLCLGTLLGQYDLDLSSPHVLLVDVEGGLVGFIVPTLRAIEESIWEERPRDPRRPAHEMLRKGPLVKVAAPLEPGRMIPLIDLHRIAREHTPQAVHEDLAAFANA